MTTNSESIISDKPTTNEESKGRLLRLGAVAVASALIGGIAAAWWYRKTIQKFHETGENTGNPHFGIDSYPSKDSMTDES